MMNTNGCLANIITTNNFTIIEQNLAKITSTDALVIFDIDQVLLQQTDQVLQHHEQLQHFIREYQDKLGVEQFSELHSLLFLKAKIEPVDSRLIKLIADLQQRNIKILALTHAYTGKWGQINSAEDFRVAQLNSLGYQLDKSWANVANKQFTELAVTSNNAQFIPVFTRGILLTGCKLAKGEILSAFLTYAQLQPKQIIFIDDQMKNLESVAMAAKQLNIKFLGIEYTKATEFAKAPLNMERAQLQFKMLEQQQRWISDSEADVLLSKD